jgi:tetratricopeptide (TPR) repeat protein
LFDPRRRLYTRSAAAGVLRLSRSEPILESRAARVLILLAPIALAVTVFGRTIAHDFLVRDDDDNIYLNTGIDTDSLSGVPGFWTAPTHGLYIPVTYTVWALIARVSGRTTIPEAHEGEIVSPALFHGANVLLHVASVALVLSLIHRGLGRRDLPAAALGAALFAIHPLQVEAVAWATGLKDVLSALLALSSLALFSRAAELRAETGKLPRLLYALSLAAFAGGVLAKPQVVVLPAIAAAFAAGVEGRPTRATLTALIPFFALGGVFAWATIGQQSEPDAFFPLVPPPLWQRPLVALDALGFYAWKLVWPASLTIDYGRNPDVALASALARPLWIVPLCAAFAVSRIRTGRRVAAAALGIAVLGVLPVLGLVPFGYQGHSTVADRYVYLSLFGCGLALAAWIASVRTPTARWVAVAALAALTIVSARQVSWWQTSSSLFRRALEVNPSDVASAYNLALAASNAGRFDEALEGYRRTIAMKEDLFQAHNNIGVILTRRGQFEEALPHLRRAAELEPAELRAKNNLGVALLRTGRFEEAVACYRDMAAIRPDSPEILVNLAVALGRSGRLDETIEVLGEAIRLKPDWPRPRTELAGAYMAQERYQDAARVYRECVAADPQNPDPHWLLAQALAAAGEREAARDAVARALELATSIPGYPPERIEQMRRHEESVRTSD